MHVAVLFPELLGTYGDGGNVLVLRQRLAWRGVAVELVPVSLRDPVPDSCDLYVLGGGEDRAQEHALEALRRSGALGRAVNRGSVVFAVCAGLQLLGSTITYRDGAVCPGLGLLDLTTTLLDHRAIGDVVAEPAADLGLPRMKGFANHAGSTVLGPAARPLAEVISGPGNSAAEGGQDGARQGAVLATYLHGPVLARNPALADLVLSRVLGRPLDPLPDDEPDPR